jgi:hypothetical protein
MTYFLVMSNSISPHRKKTLPHVVTGLIAKRKELAGIVQDLEKRSKAAALELTHVEAALRVFKPDIDMARFNPRPVRPRHAAFKGETSRAVLRAIREAQAPLGTNELTEIVMKTRGLSLDDIKLCQTMVDRVRACLKHWRERGVLRSVQGPDGILVWEISPTDSATISGFDAQGRYSIPGREPAATKSTTG